MVKIDTLFAESKISRISELEIERYITFFTSSYLDNLEHSRAVAASFPRWSIISGYYAMHDLTKLLIAKQFRIKIELEVHATTIKVLKELLKNKELDTFMENGYREFVGLANDLVQAKEERTRVQYYTGSDFMKLEYTKKAAEFIKEIVEPYITKINSLLK